MSQGIDQREEHLLQLVDEYRDEVKELQFKLESSWKPAEESQTVTNLVTLKDRQRKRLLGH